MIESARLPAHGAFALHPQLAADTYALGRLPLSLVLLMNDANYPWFILVPQRTGVTELHDLDGDDQQQLMRESCDFSRWAKRCFGGDKMNVAALGNIVPQLHVHHVVRFRNDPAWPAPVWGRATALPYSSAGLQRIQEHIDKPDLRNLGFAPLA